MIRWTSGCLRSCRTNNPFARTSPSPSGSSSPLPSIHTSNGPSFNLTGTYDNHSNPPSFGSSASSLSPVSPASTRSTSPQQPQVGSVCFWSSYRRLRIPSTVSGIQGQDEGHRERAAGLPPRKSRRRTGYVRQHGFAKVRSDAPRRFLSFILTCSADTPRARACRSSPSSTARTTHSPSRNSRASPSSSSRRTSRSSAYNAVVECLCQRLASLVVYLCIYAIRPVYFSP